jgi:polyphosphate glucokinase
MDSNTDPGRPNGPLTLAIDIGGTGLKVGILDASGHLVGTPERTITPANAKPADVLDLLLAMAARLGPFERVSVGFPGVVRHGVVITAPNLDHHSWHRFPLAEVLSERLERPTRVLNDAEVQGLGVISGQGLECVITLGTGMGFGLYQDGRLAPHLELSQHPIHKGKTYDLFIGNAALALVGRKRWNRRLRRVLANITTLVGFDSLYIGGGNSRHVTLELPANIHIVSNDAGLTGGVRLWDPMLDDAFAARSPAIRDGADAHQALPDR